MTQQIEREHNRLIENYRRALTDIQRLAAIEIERLDPHQRLSVRHAVSDAARIILETEAKIKIFDQLVWGTTPRPSK